MIELKEENKEELERVMIIAQLVPSQTIVMPSNLKDKLLQTLWNKKETLVIRINSISERQKEVHKVQAWEEAETKLRTKIQILLENQVGTLKKIARKVQSPMKIRITKEALELNTLKEATEVPMTSTTLQKKSQPLVYWKRNDANRDFVSKKMRLVLNK